MNILFSIAFTICSLKLKLPQ